MFNLQRNKKNGCDGSHLLKEPKKNWNKTYVQKNQVAWSLFQNERKD